jgi:carboxyl-terminal processing protease
MSSRWIRAVALAAVAFVGGAVATGFAHASTARGSAYDVLDQLARVLVLVENQYVEPVDRERLVRGAIKGMVAELDPHSSYLPRQDFAVFQQDTRGRFGGIGVEVDFTADFVTVIAPIDGSPAQRAGIRSGDRIIAIDGALVRNKSPEGLVRQMRGEPGTQVTVTVRREGADKLLEFTLTREVIQVASVLAKRLVGDVAYLRIKQFQAGTHAELTEAIARLRRESPHPIAGVMLDVRNNPGGLVDEAVAVADEFLTGGVIFTTRHRDRVVDEVTATTNGALRTGPMVLLVNAYSASAAELVAGALRDQRRATVVGTRTFGKGSVQTILDLPGGDGLRLTTMRYYTPAGDAIQARGIVPDVRVDAAHVSEREATPVLRESDLENHLPAEGLGHAEEQPHEASQENRGGDDSSATHLGVARQVPDNPVGGDDLALSVGYQIVTGVLRRGQ